MILLVWIGGLLIGVGIGGRVGFWIAGRLRAEEVTGEVEQERERCAALVEAAGCVAQGACGGGYKPEMHAHNCPIALAAKIRETP